MDTHATKTQEELIEKIQTLQILLEEMKEEKNRQELLDFPWAGNLGSWYWYIKTNQVICNDQKIFALGFQKEEIPEQIGFEFFTNKIHPDDFDRVMNNMRNHLYGKSPVYDTSYRIRTTDGQWKWFYDKEKITRRDEDGKPILLTGIVFDISEQKAMEELLETQNQQLIELSNTDYLTKILNRKALMEKLDYEIRRINRTETNLCFFMIDVDHFKKVNDTYGHLTGDKVLIQMTQIIQKIIRSTDFFGRFGGEEFIVVFPDCDLTGGLEVAERIRTTIQNSVFEAGIRITISGGLVAYQGETIDQMMEVADRLLYKAKESGRNQIRTL